MPDALPARVESATQADTSLLAILTDTEPATLAAFAWLAEALIASRRLLVTAVDTLAATTSTAYTMENGRVRIDAEIHTHEHVHAHVLGTCPHEHYPPK